MDRFTKVKNIGKGNMGACTLVRNNEDGRHYVIKQVDLAKLNKKERQQSLNEAKVLSSLRHPNIINYVDSFLARKSDHLCIVMEFADGGDLSQKIKASHGVNFSQDQVLDWAIQTALALQHIHSKKILHRDVKTQNVFLTSDGMAKLGDFGIARTLNSTFDQANTFVGTPYYLSPELILERPYDQMSDVWAFGVCLYETMALKHPFNANDMKSLMQRILKVQYEAPPQCYSPELRSVVQRILVKDPSQRMKLTEMLELPIMRNRMMQWLQGGIVPSRYISSLIRHKLLPASVMPAVQNEKPSAVGSFPQVAQKPKATNNAVPMFGGSQQSSGAATGLVPLPPSNQQQHQQQQQQQVQSNHMAGFHADENTRQQKRDEIRSEFRDVRLKPKPPIQSGVMPTRDPTLLNQNADHQQQGGYSHRPYGQQQQQAANAAPQLGGGGGPNMLPSLPRRTSNPPQQQYQKPPGHVPPIGNAANFGTGAQNQQQRAYNLPGPSNQNIHNVLDKVPAHGRGGGLPAVHKQQNAGGALPPIANPPPQQRW